MFGGQLKLSEILKKENFSKEEIITLLELESEEDREALYKKALAIKKEYLGDEILNRGIIRFSNNCEENCPYCRIQESNFSLKRYRMEPDEIIDAAVQAYHNGITRILLRSGKDSVFDTDIIAYLIYTIKQKTDLSITLCLSERGLDEYKSWRIAGADRYMMRFTSSNPVLFKNFHKNNTFDARINNLKYLKRIGYKIGSGNFIGIPNQTTTDIADDLVLAKSLGIDMAAFSPFLPSKLLSLKLKESPSLNKFINTIAVSRILLKNIQIISPFSLNQICSDGRNKGIDAGANVVMQNCTPSKYDEEILFHPEFQSSKTIFRQRMN